ncbi:MAG: radical SAM protein [Chloroflexi bacterium]|nr:radical SAM protein [Chloroflexota bacterium]
MLWIAPGSGSCAIPSDARLQITGCYVPETHDPAGGVEMSVAHAVAAVLDRFGEPRDGMTVNGGEPFFQPVGLLTLLRQIKERGLHIVVYTGYTLEALARCSEVQVAESLHLTDLLIEGPFVAALSEGAGEWRGSRNQRLIANPASALASSPHTHKHGLSIARP